MSFIIDPYIHAPVVAAVPDFSLDSDSLSLSDNDPVGSWTDSIGGLVYGASGTARPTFKTNIVNSQPVVRFATDDVLTPSGSAFTYGENNTMVVVCTERVSGTGYIFSGNQTSPSAQGGPSFITGFNPGAGVRDFEYFMRVTGERYPFAVSAAAGFHILTIVRDDGGAFGEILKMYFDGALVQTQTVVGTDNWNGLTLAKIGDFSAGDFYNGDIAVIRHFPSLLSNGQLNIVHAALGTKYGISVTML